MPQASKNPATWTRRLRRAEAIRVSLPDAARYGSTPVLTATKIILAAGESAEQSQSQWDAGAMEHRGLDSSHLK
jgi:hypothetical protein